MTQRAIEIGRNLDSIRSRIESAALAADRNPDSITLIAVTKTFPVSDIKVLYELGIRNFAENRDQEGSVKAPELPEDSIWHFQGQIQSNKLRSIADWADVIHSIDEIRHAIKLSNLVQRRRIFVQVSLDESSEKINRGGVEPANLASFLAEILALENLDLLGLMAVAPLDEEPAKAFARLNGFSNSVSTTYPESSAISAGMSGDFEAAIALGATHIRIGSQILGVR